ncbi:MAG TPA: hypothetical protein VHB69_10575 [Mycobacteriales bacterium]|nr:hypothetical protein [Mycobacteriales bacterium]
MYGRRLSTRLGAALVGLTTVTAVALATPQAASASGFLPTTTTVPSPGIVANGTRVNVPLSAQVALLAPLPLLTKTGVGLILTPSSSVYWTVYGPGSVIGIDTPRAKLSSCLVLISACTANGSISLAGAPDGVYTVVAHYLGDDLAGASSGSTTFVLGSVPTTTPPPVEED